MNEQQLIQLAMAIFGSGTTVGAVLAWLTARKAAENKANETLIAGLQDLNDRFNKELAECREGHRNCQAELEHLKHRLAAVEGHLRNGH